MAPAAVLLLPLLSLASLAGSAAAFAPPPVRSEVRAPTVTPTGTSPKRPALRMAPRFDPSTQRWYPTEPEDTDGYPPFGSLIRQGPRPFLERLLKADEYEQAVYKYMASSGVDRREAQGNMDAYLRNPNDWAFQKGEEARGGSKLNYGDANTSPKQVLLTATWATMVGAYMYDVVVNYDKYAPPVVRDAMMN